VDMSQPPILSGEVSRSFHDHSQDRRADVSSLEEYEYELVDCVHGVGTFSSKLSC